jgi:hypothetical protein
LDIVATSKRTFALHGTTRLAFEDAVALELDPA